MVKHLQTTLLHRQKMTLLRRMVLHHRKRLRKRTKRLQMGKRRRRRVTLRVRRVATPVEETKKLRSNFCDDDSHLEKIPTCVFSFPQLH